FRSPTLVGSSLPTKVVPTTVRLVLSTGFLLVSSLLLSLYKMFDKPTGGCAAKMAVSRMGSEQKKYAIVAMIAYIIMIICLFIGWIM
ncbi:MAG: hypothetical protein IKJ51_06980, partial [Clostridia bacterium]|nr:hypothetical protein [Clostridia bacterium]